MSNLFNRLPGFQKTPAGQERQVLRRLPAMAPCSERGGSVVLEMSRRDSSQATHARLVEDEDTKILSAFVTSAAETDDVEVTLKLNRPDIARVIATFERHEYDVKETFAETDYSDNMRERYESLMNYLNV